MYRVQFGLFLQHAKMKEVIAEESASTNFQWGGIVY